MEYDIYGNRMQLTDPNAGTSYSVFDVFGQLRESTDAKGNETHFDYDKLGRITSEILDGNTKTYRYDQDFVGAISAIFTRQTTWYSNTTTPAWETSNPKAM